MITAIMETINPVTNNILGVIDVFVVPDCICSSICPYLNMAAIKNNTYAKHSLL